MAPRAKKNPASLPKGIAQLGKRKTRESYWPYYELCRIRKRKRRLAAAQIPSLVSTRNYAPHTSARLNPTTRGAWDGNPREQSNIQRSGSGRHGLTLVVVPSAQLEIATRTPGIGPATHCDGYASWILSAARRWEAHSRAGPL